MKKALATFVMGAFISCMAFAAPTTQSQPGMTGAGQTGAPTTTKHTPKTKTGKTGMRHTRKAGMTGRKATTKPTNTMPGTTGTQNQNK